MNEAETRTELLNPALKEKGWELPHCRQPKRKAGSQCEQVDKTLNVV